MKENFQMIYYDLPLQQGTIALCWIADGFSKLKITKPKLYLSKQMNVSGPNGDSK